MALSLCGRGLGGVAFAFAFAASACGPSFQVVYDGDRRFEHCYALDDNPTAPMQDKAACWHDWMRRYTVGQTRDRVEYAAMRARALTRAPSLPTDEALMEAAPGQSTKRGVAAPAPTSAFAPPPRTMGEEIGRPLVPPIPSASLAALAPPPADGPVSPPAAACQDDCSRLWDTCRRSDLRPRARGEADVCTRSYGSCMRTCFK
jgi:hypothetical protein